MKFELGVESLRDLGDRAIEKVPNEGDKGVLEGRARCALF